MLLSMLSAHGAITIRGPFKAKASTQSDSPESKESKVLIRSRVIRRISYTTWRIFLERRRKLEGGAVGVLMIGRNNYRFGVISTCFHPINQRMIKEGSARSLFICRALIRFQGHDSLLIPSWKQNKGELRRRCRRLIIMSYTREFIIMLPGECVWIVWKRSSDLIKLCESRHWHNSRFIPCTASRGENSRRFSWTK